MLIVEGTDMTGKTTFCQKLLQRLNARDLPAIYDHFGVLPKGWDYYRSYLPRINPLTVMDRFHMSEIVYAQVTQRGQRLDPETYRLIDAHCRLAGAVTVVITAPTETIKTRFRTLHEREMYDVHQIVAVNAAFLDLRRPSTPDHWSYPYKRIDVDFYWVATPECPFPDEDEAFVSKVVDLYEKRQANVRAISAQA